MSKKTAIIIFVVALIVATMTINGQFLSLSLQIAVIAGIATCLITSDAVDGIVVTSMVFSGIIAAPLVFRIVT